MWTKTFGTLAVALLFSFSGLADQRPNIVLLYVDDLGWNDLGFMGSDLYETPEIDQLAAQAVVFNQAYANAPNCAPSRACLFTGQYSPRHGVYTVHNSERGRAERRKIIPTKTETEVPQQTVLFSDLLKEAGYATCHLGKWHLGHTPETSPLAQGFDVNKGGYGKGHPASYFSPYKNPALEDGPKGEHLTDRLTDEAIAFMRANRDKPFFVNFSYYSVHTPIQAKQELTDRFQAKLAKLEQEGTKPKHWHAKYAAMITVLDESVGRIKATLRELGVENRTVIIFTSDNGGHGGVTLHRPLRGVKGMLYEGGIRVPMFVYWPAKFKAQQVETPIIGMDLFPTILELAGVEVPKELTIDGESIVPLLQNQNKWKRETLHWHFPAYLQGRHKDGHDQGWRTTPAAAMRHGDWKLIEYFETGELELFNLADDVGEQKNLAQSNAEKVAELHAIMKSWRVQVSAPVPSEPNPKYKPR